MSNEDYAFLLFDAYAEQPYTLCDHHAHCADCVTEVVEGFVGAVWSGQIKTNKRII